MPRKLESEQDRNQAREYGKNWYRRNSARVKAQKQDRRNEIQMWFVAHKARLKCQRCGESDLAVLDFHHRDPASKELSLAQAVHNGWSVDRLVQEMSKCDVLCANCHLRLHSSGRK